MSQDLSLKHSKGVAVMNGTSKEEQKELRKDIIEFTRTCIAKGYSYKEKTDALSARYGVTNRQAKKYVAYTREDIRKRKNENMSQEIDDVVIKLDYLYRQCVAAGDTKAALAALNQLIKLRGYEAPKQLLVKQEVTAKTDLSHLTPDELLLMQQRINKSNGTIDIGHEEV